MNIRKQSSKSIDIDVHSKITAKYKGIHSFFPQQRKLMGSSAQNSSGVHWCRPRVRFNEVLEKVLKVPEKVWKALVQSQVRFNRVLEKVAEKVWEALVHSQVRFNRVPEKVPEKVRGNLGAKPSQVRRRFRRRFGRLWCRGQVQQDLRPFN